ncbi:hypothetical protein M514_05176 [Trichuris suis]|uniref:Mos1 transposase HTH domain-containing protein n=1 Tax=Trichuris suis TaxID=68888 RepID=A0A085MZX9_9BILA|nr:hypothetical protein M513_05176 [Trichuris suis]KFD62775.1 hypothetical protein M514_05176 [Trichuris suis]
MKQRKEWLSPGKDPTPRAKPKLQERKTMLSVWWDCVEPDYHRHNLCGTVTALGERNSAEKAKEATCHHAAARQCPTAHSNIITKTAIQELGWDVLPHPGYSPDLPPSDYHLFRSLAVNLRGVPFNNDEGFQKWLSDFFSSKPPHFYRKGIEQLASRWEEVVNSEGEYIAD